MNSNYEIDFTTLNWVKQELEDTLKQARQSLESYVDDPQDASLMRFCASYLHQVQGTLRMVELYGAAMVVEEMERLAQSLLEGKVRQTDEAYQILMRGMLQVPDYLDRLQGGHRDIPIVLLPLLNDLRACRGEKLLTETALFAPDLSRALPASAAGPAQALPEPVLKANAARLRMAFQLGLLKWFKGEEVSANTARLALILERLQSATAQTDGRRLWWISAGLLDAIRAGQVESSVAIKLLIGRVDREIKQLVDLGEGIFARQPPQELSKNLLYYLAQVDGAGDRVEQIQALYGLRSLLPSSEELEHARGVMSGANRQLLDTVGDAIKEDVLRVKDALDLYLRTGSENAAELEPQGEALHRVADTLGMLGLGVPRRLVLDQKDTIDQIVAGKRNADESTLLDIAGALLYVESSLDDHIAHLGRDSSAPGSADRDGGLELPQAEVRQILEATMKEAQGNVQQAKQDIVAFIESPWDHSKIEELPRLLDEITGALRMLNLPDAAALLHGITRFIDLELLKYRRVPSGEQLDLLADALASIEYYMEALRDQRGNRERILEVTQRSLEALGYWPLPEMLDSAASDTEETVAETPAAATEFPSFGGDFMAVERPVEGAAEVAPEDEWPSIDLPPVETVLTDTVVETEVEPVDEMPTDMQPAVEIAPGEGLESLVVGETDQPATEPAATDFHGLRFTLDEEAGSGAADVAEARDEAGEPAWGGEEAAVDTLVSGTEAEEASGSLEMDSALDFELEVVEQEGGGQESAEQADLAPDETLPDLSWDAPEALVEPVSGIEAEAAEMAEAAVAETAAPDEGDLASEAKLESAADESAPEESELSFDEDRFSLEDLSLDSAVDMDLGSDAARADAEAVGEAQLEAPAESTFVEPVQVTPARITPPVHSLDVPDSAFQAVPSDEIDEEIREVFVEEVQDELENLNRQYPLWVADQSDQDKLKPVRRSFHTLKGSGRLVGALAIGEFSWKIENMLNRVLDKSIAVTPAMLDLMDQAIAVLPQLLAALRGEGPPTANIGAIMWCADRLSAGEEVWLPKAEPAPIAADNTAAASEAGATSATSEVVEAGIEIETGATEAAVEGDLSAVLDSPEQVVEAEAATVDIEPAATEVETTQAVAPPAHVSPLEVDPVLMEILHSEVGAHLQAIRDYLAEWYAQDAGMPASEELLRAVHTLNGAVSMVELPAIAGLVSPLEGYLKRARGHDLMLDRRAADLLTEAADAIDECMERLERAEALPDLDRLIEEAVALRDGLPVVERGYQAFGIHMAEDLGTDLPLDDSAVAVESPVDASASGSAGVAAADRPWYEADLGEDAVALLDELGTVEAQSVSEAQPTEAREEAAEAGTAPLADELADVSAATEVQPVEGAVDRPWYEADLAEIDELELDDSVRTQASEPALETAAEAGLDELEEMGELTEIFDAIDDAGLLLDEGSGGVESDQVSELPRADTEAPLSFDDGSDVVAEIEGFAFEETELLSDEQVGATTAVDEFTALDSELVEVELSDELGPAIVDQAPDEEAVEEQISVREESVELEVEEAQVEEAQVEEAQVEEAQVEEAQVEEAQVEEAQIEEAQIEEAQIEEAQIEEAQIEEAQVEEALAEDAQSEEDQIEHVVGTQLEDLELSDKAEAEFDTVEVELAPPIEAELGEAASEDLLAGETDAASAAPAAEGARTRMPVDPHPEEPMDTTDLDAELLEIFLQEGVEILDQSDSMMAQLRQAPDDRDIIAGLQRELHTLKGGARMAGVAPIGDLSHAMESLFEALVEGRSTATGQDTVEVLEHSFDALHRMLQRVQQGRAIATPDRTIGVLEALQRGEMPTFMSEAPALPVTQPIEPETPVEAADQAAPVTNDAAVDAAQEASDSRRYIQPARPESLRRPGMEDDEPMQRMQQEVIRVRADLIDNLVNFAGEVSIYRSRLEAQIGGFRFNLVEFDQTVTRLREQLRKLEMETEAQILSRYQREMEHLPGDPEFDPLELDRFSTLQQLSRALAESVSDLLSLQNLMDDIARQSETLLLQQSRVSSDLQEGLMRTRMVPFESLVPRLRRILRQTSAELGKRAQLKVEGAQGEMDRTVLERMTAPLEHMLRNALAHGLESPAERLVRQKNEEGTIGIAVSRDATEVVIKITDDGRGMDRDAIRSKAIERGLIRDDAQLSDRDLFQFVLETGFSTATEVSKIAGRGVGMDVVNSEIRQLGGSLQIDSERGRGTVFTVRLPFTLAVTQAILIKLADALFAVPMTSIQGVMRMSRKDFDQRQLDQQTEVTYGGETYHIYDLGDLLGNPVSHSVDDGQIPLLMTRTGDQRAAIRVSTVVGSREIVVKSVGPQLSSVPGFFGATIMGDGSVVVILDLAPLVRHGAALRQAPELAAEIEAELPAPVVVRRAPLVMVVDDSITMRKVTSRVLERNELDVITAKDGLDAVEQLQDKVPDVMLLDIEMPRMDGYELATYMKNDPRLRKVPIIMITSRTGEKHRQRALEIGVERYLGKPYQESDLLQNVREALGQGATDGVN
jgi:chemosensory pili system protein ChpA (sensor histidine kinase/response regulator)